MRTQIRHNMQVSNRFSMQMLTDYLIRAPDGTAIVDRQRLREEYNITLRQEIWFASVFLGFYHQLSDEMSVYLSIRDDSIVECGVFRVTDCVKITCRILATTSTSGMIPEKSLYILECNQMKSLQDKLKNIDK